MDAINGKHRQIPHGGERTGIDHLCSGMGRILLKHSYGRYKWNQINQLSGRTFEHSHAHISPVGIGALSKLIPKKGGND
jgi:hypothetical protein